MMLPVDGSTVHKPPSLSYLHAPELAPSLAADAIRLLPIQGSKPATAITSARDSAALTSSAAASMTKLATASASPPTKSMSQGFTDRASNVPAALGIKDSSSGLVANVATESAITTLSTQFVPTHFDVNHKQTSPAEATAPYLMDVQTSDAGDAGDAPVAQIATSPVPKIGLAQKLSNSVASRDQSIIDTPRGISEVRKTSEGVTFAASVAVNGTTVGRLPLLIRDGQNISVRLSDVLETLKPMMDSDLHDSLTGSTASGEYVTLDDLRAAGVSAQFSDDDQLSLRLR
jgi:hypothetical protein